MKVAVLLVAATRVEPLSCARTFYARLLDLGLSLGEPVSYLSPDVRSLVLRKILVVLELGLKILLPWAHKATGTLAPAF
jgi:hypothetical protein